MSFLNVYVHFVWTTKHRIPYLCTPGIRNQVWLHMMQRATEKDIFIDFINGHNDHCHCLISMNANQPIGQCIKLIKGESAYWINKTNLLEGTRYTHFEWQEAYYGVSVCPRKIDMVRNYIRRQEEHHISKSLNDELQNYTDHQDFI